MQKCPVCGTFEKNEKQLNLKVSKT